MSADYDAIVGSPLPGGLRLGILMAGPALAAIDLLPPDVALRRPRSAATAAVTAALDAYFGDPTAAPVLAYAAGGTPFQRRVWDALAAIPCGTTRGYGELAAALGSGPRAVAGACRRNTIPILVPCHRVVAAGGWGGYMGRSDGPELLIKRWLLAHEQRR